MEAHRGVNKEIQGRVDNPDEHTLARQWRKPPQSRDRDVEDKSWPLIKTRGSSEHSLRDYGRLKADFTAQASCGTTFFIRTILRAIRCQSGPSCDWAIDASTWGRVSMQMRVYPRCNHASHALHRQSFSQTQVPPQALQMRQRRRTA